MVKKKDFDEWLKHPVTEAYFKAVEAVRDASVAYWNDASWNDNNLWQTGKAEYLRAAARGRAECAQDILNIRFEEDNEQERDQSD